MSDRSGFSRTAISHNWHNFFAMVDLFISISELGTGGITMSQTFSWLNALPIAGLINQGFEFELGVGRDGI